MPSRGHGPGLRPELRQDLLRCHNAGTEGIPIVLDAAVQFAGQRLGLRLVQLKVHQPKYRNSTLARLGGP
jgi:hypothetical protein